jgi:hypothetical protein
MFKIYGEEGEVLGTLYLTEKQQKILDSGEQLVVIYHTPQLLQNVLGTRSGSIILVKQGEQIRTATPGAARDFIALQAAIKTARESN